MKTDIKSCARCDGDHDDLEMKDLTNPIVIDEIEIANYWGLCPVTNEPILIHVTTSGNIYGGNL